MKSSKAHYISCAYYILPAYSLGAAVQCVAADARAKQFIQFIHFISSLFLLCMRIVCISLYTLVGKETVLFDYRFLLPFSWVWCCCCLLGALFTSQKSPKDLICFAQNEHHTKHMVGICVVIFAAAAADFVAVIFSFADSAGGDGDLTA